MKEVLYIFILIVSTSLFAQDDKPIEVPKIGVNIQLSESIQLDGFSVLFKEVIEDSRCPANVQCAWAGRAKVLVIIKTLDGEKIEKTLVFNPGKGVITNVFGKKELQFLKLSPYPDANIAREDRAPYSLLMRTK